MNIVQLLMDSLCFGGDKTGHPEPVNMNLADQNQAPKFYDCLGNWNYLLFTVNVS